MSVSGNVQKQIVQAAASVYKQAETTCNGTTYVQLIASTSATILVTHVYRRIGTGYNQGATTVTLATGAAASETALFTFTHPDANDNQLYCIPLLYPMRIPANTRVAMKLSQSDAFNTSTYVGILYVNEGTVA